MENASKALIIAGETLIAILVLSLIVYTTTVFGKFSANMNSKLEKNKQIDFNNRFLKYERKIDITSDEIISIINFAKQSNDSYELFLSDGYDVISQSAYFVDVWIGSSSFFRYISSDTEFHKKTAEFLKNHNMHYFSCSASPIISINHLSTTGKIELKPNTINNDIEIDDSEGGTQLVKKITFNQHNTPYFGYEYSINNKDMFEIN